MSSKVSATTPVIGSSTLSAMLRQVHVETFKPAPANSFTVPQYARENNIEREVARREVNALIRLKHVRQVGMFSVYDTTSRRKQFLPHFEFTKPSA